MFETLDKIIAFIKELVANFTKFIDGLKNKDIVFEKPVI